SISPRFVSSSLLFWLLLPSGLSLSTFFPYTTLFRSLRKNLLHCHLFHFPKTPLPTALPPFPPRTMPFLSDKGSCCSVRIASRRAPGRGIQPSEWSSLAGNRHSSDSG